MSVSIQSCYQSCCMQAGKAVNFAIAMFRSWVVSPCKTKLNCVSDALVEKALDQAAHALSISDRTTKKVPTKKTTLPIESPKNGKTTKTSAPNDVPLFVKILSGPLLRGVDKADKQIFYAEVSKLLNTSNG